MGRHTRTFHSHMWDLALDDYLRLYQLGVIGLLRNTSQIFYVDPANGSDENPGYPFEAPVKTIAHALSLVESERGDFVLLKPSTTVVTEGDISVAKADLVISGLADPNSELCTINSSSAATTGIFTLTAAADRVRIQNLYFNDGTAAKPCIVTANGATNVEIHNCKFVLTQDSAIDFDAGAVGDPVIKDCTFQLGDGAGVPIVMECGTSGGLIEGCTIINGINGSGTPPADGILVKAGTGLIIRNCDIHGGDAATAYNLVDGIDIDAGVINTLITRCTIGECDNAVTDGGTDTTGVTNGVTALS